MAHTSETVHPATIDEPKSNAARTFNGAIRDALAGRYRRPCESMIGAYHEGWQAAGVPLPDSVSWGDR